jgi:hypothetical protein
LENLFERLDCHARRGGCLTCEPHTVRTERPGAAQEAIRTLTFTKSTPYAKGGCGADPGIRYTYARLEQGYKEELVFTQALGEAYSASAADANVSP